MGEYKPITVETVKAVCLDAEKDWVVVVGLDRAHGKLHTTTYGVSAGDKSEAFGAAEVVRSILFGGDPPQPVVHEHFVLQAAESAARVEQLEAERDKLHAFKVWVHDALDARGVPHHPPGPHGAAGCRIGDRLDWVFAEVARLRGRDGAIGDGELVLALAREEAAFWRRRATGLEDDLKQRGEQWAAVYEACRRLGMPDPALAPGTDAEAVVKYVTGLARAAD